MPAPFELKKTVEGLPFYEPAAAKAPAPPPGYSGDPSAIPTPPDGFTLQWDGKDFTAVPVTAAPAAGPTLAGKEAPVRPESSLLDRALSPITRYPEVYKHKVDESVGQIGRGATQLGETYGAPWKADTWKGLGNLGLGALGYTFSPIEAGIESLVGQPVQDVTGLPKEYTNFATGLAIPGLGLTKMPRAATPGQPAMWPTPARRAEEILSPETVAPEAQKAAALIREHSGVAARNTETMGALVEPYYAPISKLPQAEQWNIQNFIDGGASATKPATPQLRALVDTLKAGFQERKAALQALPSNAQRDFLENYFPHMWQDPNAAKAFTQSWGLGRQGSGASLKGRSMPTFEDGIKAGLKPAFDNPIEAAMRYFMSMDKFIAAERTLAQAVKDGTVIPVNTKIIGATGRPGSKAGVPPGYVELTGRGGEGMYAPEAWARIYNNWLSPGFERFPTGGKVYEAARKFTNGMTQTLLGFSGYHAFTMAEAAMATDIARAVGGTPKGLVSYTTAPVRYAKRGSELKNVYLNKAAKVSPEDKEIVDLITEAGGRMAGTRHALDYQASALGDYLTSWRRSQLKGQFSEQWQGMKAAPVTGTASAALSNMARVLETVNKPLFQHYIPNIKNGVAAELVSDFIKANPAATKAEKLAATRRIVDSVDNRFGEMIQDNVFWNKMFKQAAMLSMLSYSWNLGGWREIGGGMRDIARTAVGRQEWSPKASYVVGTAINWSILSALYQYAKTGQKPTDTDTPVLDLLAPRTGGTDSRSGQPERIIVPGIMKDVFGYYEHPVQEVLNKMNPGLKAVGQVFGNSDWRGDPVFEPKPRDKSMMNHLPVWLGNLFEHVAKTGTPITFQNVGKQETGSNLSTPERMLGVRTAPRYLTDPQGSEDTREKMQMQKWFGSKRRPGKLQHDERDKARYGGPI